MAARLVPTNNNPINARARSLGPRLLLFSEVSYCCVGQESSSGQTKVLEREKTECETGACVALNIDFEKKKTRLFCSLPLNRRSGNYIVLSGR